MDYVWNLPTVEQAEQSATALLVFARSEHFLTTGPCQGLHEGVSEEIVPGGQGCWKAVHGRLRHEEIGV